MNLFPAVVAVGLAFGLAVVAKGKPPETAVASMITPARAGTGADGDRYRLQSVSDRACRVSRGAETGAGTYAIRADADCERLLPGLSKVRFWQERDDGIVVFSRDGTDELVTFAEADGVAYESFRPASALISLATDD
jgi:hypothetical protein